MNTGSEKRVEVKAVEFKVCGRKCLRWFDSRGRLRAIGPDEIKTEIHAYVQEFGPKVIASSFVAVENSIGPAGIELLPLKKHVLLELLEEEAEKLRRTKCSITREGIVGFRISSNRVAEKWDSVIRRTRIIEIETPGLMPITLAKSSDRRAPVARAKKRGR
jgi:hypothetical protein